MKIIHKDCGGEVSEVVSYNYGDIPVRFKECKQCGNREIGSLHNEVLEVEIK